MIMPLCHRLSRNAPLWAAALLGLGAHAVSASAAALADSKAAVANAEKALQRGDCGIASGLYQQAAQARSEVDLAARASAVALACGQYPTARSIAQHWLQLAPGDADAMLALTHAELGNYQIPEARGHFKTLLNASKNKVPQSLDAVTQRAGAEPVLAMVRQLDDPRLHGGAAQLALAALALDGWDAKLALHYTQAARGAGANNAAAAAIAARAQAVLGDAKSAATEARLAASEPSGKLSPAQTMLLLGQDTEAVKELQRLRSDPDVGAGAARMLAQVAIDSADYAVAEQRCTTLLEDPESAPLAVFYLGLIAERRGDDEAASRDYALLSGTGFESQGRQRSATILYRQGERDAAVRVLNATRDAAPDQRIRADLAAADLLSTSGAADEALSRIDSALRRSPGNPEITYQRAVLLDRAGRVDAAIAALEAMHRERPLDGGITNALGYTLADHKRELPRAEQLIREALAAQPDNPALLDSLGWVLYRRGQYVTALPQLARAFRLLHDGDVGAHWGEALWAAGQKPAARSTWQRALAADPDNKLLITTVHRYAPTLATPKPPPALEPAPRTSI
ncbi:MAG TPA: tetratricopeptide repeat protein [Steroidobacteraceae bacterium]|nr:tetratricopeptide repeat protein [Steroidobacteraceae bacterium]